MVEKKNLIMRVRKACWCRRSAKVQPDGKHAKFWRWARVPEGGRWVTYGTRAYRISSVGARRTRSALGTSPRGAVYGKRRQCQMRLPSCPLSGSRARAHEKSQVLGRRPGEAVHGQHAADQLSGQWQALRLTAMMACVGKASGHVQVDGHVQVGTGT